MKEVIWLSKISLSKDWENNIREYFVNEKIVFKYPNNILVMDDVWGLADKSESFAIFLLFLENLDCYCIHFSFDISY